MTEAAATSSADWISYPPASERIADAHAARYLDDWQYGVVWRFARSDDPAPVLGPPEGDGWELNTDYGVGGQESKPPRWSDGNVVQQSTNWRRRSPGMRSYMPKQTVHERITWDGDPCP